MASAGWSDKANVESSSKYAIYIRSSDWYWMQYAQDD